jgi:hypothetical protein
MNRIDRALIIKKEWADKIFDEGKVWEMRTSKTNKRGRIGIVESGSGLIVGEVILVGCIEINPKNKDLIKFHKVENLPDKYCYAWLLYNARRYEKTRPYKHRRGAVIWVKL